MTTAEPKVTAVVVTFNRKELLREALAALAAQERPVDRVLVIDNASTDGTPEQVRAENPDVDLVTLETEGDGGVALVYDRSLDPVDLVRLHGELVATGRRVRLERRAKNFSNQLTSLAESGYTHFAAVREAGVAVGDLEIRELG